MSRIVIIEDVADITLIYAEILGMDGHRYQVVERDYEEWLQPNQWAEAAADVAIIDIGLPGVSGVEIARVAAASTPRPRIIFATALTERIAEEDKPIADAVLAKPFTIAELRAAVNGERNTPGL